MSFRIGGSIMLTYILEVLFKLSCLLVYRAQSVKESYFLTWNEEAELICSCLVSLIDHDVFHVWHMQSEECRSSI